MLLQVPWWQSQQTGSCSSSLPLVLRALWSTVQTRPTRLAPLLQLRLAVLMATATPTGQTAHMLVSTNRVCLRSLQEQQQQ
jgi:hypothetical protein